MTNNKTRKNKRKGGKLLAHGVYGCAFHPPLVCAKDTLNSVNTTKVGKVLKRKTEANLEYNIGLILRKIPHWEKYFVLPISKCILAKRNRQTEKNLDKCPVTKNKPTGKYHMLTMDYGGSPIRVPGDGHMSAHQFNNYAIHLIKAGAVLQDNKIVHLDLHGNNILVQNNIPKIIDFGLALDMTQSFPQDYLKHEPTLGVNQETPEMAIMTAVLDGWNLRRTIKIFPDQRVFLKNISKQSISKELSKFIIAEIELYKNKEMLALFRKYWTKQDSWAIGFELNRILYYMSKHNDNIEKGINKHILTCIHKMIDIDPRERFSCIDSIVFLLKSGILQNQ